VFARDFYPISSQLRTYGEPVSYSRGGGLVRANDQARMFLYLFTHFVD